MLAVLVNWQFLHKWKLPGEEEELNEEWKTRGAGVDHSSMTVSLVSTKNSTISSSKSWMFEERESVSKPLRAAMRHACE